MILGREGLKISYQIEKKFIGADKHVHKKVIKKSINQLYIINNNP